MSRKCRYLKYNLLLSHRSYEDSLVVRHDDEACKHQQADGRHEKSSFLTVDYISITNVVSHLCERELLEPKETESAIADSYQQLLIAISNC